MTLSPQDAYDEATDAAYDEYEAIVAPERRKLQAAVARAQAVFDAACKIAHTQFDIDTAPHLRTLNAKCKAADEAFRAAMAEHMATLDPVVESVTMLDLAVGRIEHDFTDDPD